MGKISYSVQKLKKCVLFTAFIGRSASRLFCLSWEQITYKWWVKTIHSWKQDASEAWSREGSNMQFSVTVKSQQKPQASLPDAGSAGESAVGGLTMALCRGVVCLHILALPVPSAERRPVRGCFEANSSSSPQCLTATWERRGLKCMALWTEWFKKHICWGGALSISQ